MFRGVARCSRNRLDKGITLLSVAERCGMLRRRWRQHGVKWRAAFPLLLQGVSGGSTAGCGSIFDLRSRATGAKAYRSPYSVSSDSGGVS